jgi:cytochrome P450
MHRDPRFYDRPEAFEPERWADDRRSHLPRYAYLPFGAGPRVCVGNGFAMMEATLILAALARRFRPSMAGTRAVAPFPTITLRPAEPMWMSLAAREAMAAKQRDSEITPNSQKNPTPKGPRRILATKNTKATKSLD